MLEINYTTFRDNMESYMNKVADDYETILVTGKDNQNVVMLSEEVYINLMECMYTLENESKNYPKPIKEEN